MCRLLIAGAAVVAEHRLQSTGSVLMLHRLSCSEARGILTDEGSNPGPMHWQVDYLPLDHQGNSTQCLLIGGLQVQFGSVAQLCPTLCDPMDCLLTQCMLIHCQTKLGSSATNWEI